MKLPSVAPALKLPTAELVEQLLEILLKSSTLDSRTLMVVTGAGISTESGIPDYRSAGRPAYKPLQNHEFINQVKTRQRYWARSYTGFGRFSLAAPNQCHHDVKSLTDVLNATANLQSELITQNVDRLHHRAGSHPVLELHGTIHEVTCQDCGHQYSRAWYQSRLEAHNPGWLARALAIASPRPDGDVELPQEVVDHFRIAPCERCGSEYQKPDVVWFGGNVPEHVTNHARAISERASAALVLGSTLSTYSAFRLVRTVAQRGCPVAIVNLGPTRADDLATVKVEASLRPTLRMLLRAVEGCAQRAGGGQHMTGQEEAGAVHAVMS